MAELVGVFGTAHSPVLITPQEDWPALEPRIPRDRQPSLRHDVRRDWPEHERRYHDATQELRRNILECKPDVLVIVGSDQGENFDNRSAPVFELFVGDRVDASAADRRTESAEEHRIDVAGAPELGLEVLRRLCAAGFDVAQSSEPSDEFGLGHAITWPLRFLGLADQSISVLPLVTNVWNPPNSPSIARCVALGVALRQALEDVPDDSRVAVLASGGLSHLVLDEELDARVLAALRADDLAAWQAITDEELLDAHAKYSLPLRLNGTAEITDWIIADACAQAPAHIIDYVPAYRTQSGYGVGMCFARWQLPSAHS